MSFSPTIKVALRRHLRINKMVHASSLGFPMSEESQMKDVISSCSIAGSICRAGTGRRQRAGGSMSRSVDGVRMAAQRPRRPSRAGRGAGEGGAGRTDPDVI
jgi:hypothetical protein